MLQRHALLRHDHADLRHGAHGHEQDDHEGRAVEAARVAHAMAQPEEQRAHHQADSDDLQWQEWQGDISASPFEGSLYGSCVGVEGPRIHADGGSASACSTSRWRVSCILESKAQLDIFLAGVLHTCRHMQSRRQAEL